MRCRGMRARTVPCVWPGPASSSRRDGRSGRRRSSGSVSTAGHGKWPRPPPAARQVLPGASAGAQGVQGSPPRPRPLVPAPPVAPTTAPAAHDITAEGPHRRALHRAGRCADEDGDGDGADVMPRSGRGCGGFSAAQSPPGQPPGCQPDAPRCWRIRGCVRHPPPQPNPPRAGGCERRANPPGADRRTERSPEGWTDGRRRARRDGQMDRGTILPRCYPEPAPRLRQARADCREFRAALHG